MGRPPLPAFERRRRIGAILANKSEEESIMALSDRWLTSKNETVVRACLLVNDLQLELAASQLRPLGARRGWEVDRDVWGWALKGDGGLVASVFPLDTAPRLWGWEVGIVSETRSWGPVASYLGDGKGLEGCRQAMAAAEKALKEQGG